MLLSCLGIQNFRGLREVTIPLTNFGCLIGENNAGKSSVLHALLHLLPSGSAPRKASAEDFYDKSKPIIIRLEIEEISELDLMRIKDDGHRNSMKECILDGRLTLIKEFPPDLKTTQLRVARMSPVDERLTDDVLTPLMKGLKTVELRRVVVEMIPEFDELLESAPTQTRVREVRDAWVDRLPADQLTERNFPLPTGLDAAIRPLLPEVIYIEAVKDVADDVKTTDTSIFGKLLGILLDSVADQFGDIETKFKDVQRKLSRIANSDGSSTDERLPQVRQIEKTIQSHLQESFPNVDLEIMVPAPRLKTIFSSAEMFVNDGVNGPILSKGDGLKRAFAFAILRTYTTLKNVGLDDPEAREMIGESTEPQVEAPAPQYLLLFEEPELYLYPRAQRQLMRALEVFAEDHMVLITTHSPLFFDASATKSFVKLKKTAIGAAAVPETEVCKVDLEDLDARNTFQIICHENNEIGFFAKTVVLVEGDSDVIALEQFARLLDSNWDPREHDVAFARIGGKGNIRKYREFFNAFEIDVHVICDLDILVDGFSHVSNDSSDIQRRDRLMSKVQSQLSSASAPNAEVSRAIASSGNARALWTKAVAAYEGWDGDNTNFDVVTKAVAEFFSVAQNSEKLDILRTASGEIHELKDELIKGLRASRVYVLSRGSLEDYYPAAHSHSGDKVNVAINFCAMNQNVETLKTNLGDRYEAISQEFNSIFSSIFSA